MRLVGVIALAMVLLATLFYGFERRFEFGARWGERLEAILPDERAAIDAGPTELPVVESDRQVVIAMREAGRLHALSGLPAFAKASFPLPRSATPVSGTIRFDIAGTVEDGARGRLRVAVNGVRRTEIVLEPGPLRRRLVIPLNVADMARSDVVVALSVDGIAPQTECTSEWDGGVVIRVLPSSHLELELDAPLSEPSDKLLLAGMPLALIWPATDEARAAELLELARRQLREGTEVHFTPKGHAGLELSAADLAELNARPRVPVHADIDPLDLAWNLGQRRVLSFEHAASWRMGYDRRDFDGGAAAETLRLAMSWDSAGAAEGWLLAVTLNDRLIHSESLATVSGALDREIPIPGELQLRRNEVRISLVSAEQRSGHCNPSRPAVAEIVEARLSLAPTNDQDSHWTGIRPTLTGQVGLAVASGLDALGAQAALGTLAELSEATGLEFEPGAQPTADRAMVTVLPRDAVARAIGLVDAERSWVLWLADDREGDMIALRPAQVTEAWLQAAPRSVLLVEQPRAVKSASR